jgi:hypothetical protein
LLIYPQNMGHFCRFASEVFTAFTASSRLCAG